MDGYSSRRIAGAILLPLLLTILSTGLSAMPPVSLSSPAAQVQPQTVTIPAGSTATLKVRGFCLAFGKPFPTGNMIVDGLALNTVRQALFYAIQKGYTDNNAAQVQEAIWFLQDNTWHSEVHAIGQEIVNNAAGVGAIPTGSGTALNDPAAQNILTATVLFVPQTPDAFYGDGDLQIKNTGSSEIAVYVPIGVKFTMPDGKGQFQDLVVYALQDPDATPTVAATTEATSTTAPTITAAATSTIAPAATTEVATPTVQAPVAPANTPVPAATSTPESTAPLPGTGGAEDGLVLALLVTLGCLLAGFGLIMRLRHGTR